MGSYKNGALSTLFKDQETSSYLYWDNSANTTYDISSFSKYLPKDLKYYGTKPADPIDGDYLYDYVSNERFLNSGLIEPGSVADITGDLTPIFKSTDQSLTTGMTGHLYLERNDSYVSLYHTKLDSPILNVNKNSRFIRIWILMGGAGGGGCSGESWLTGHGGGGGAAGATGLICLRISIFKDAPATFKEEIGILQIGVGGSGGTGFGNAGSDGGPTSIYTYNNNNGTKTKIIYFQANGGQGGRYDENEAIGGTCSWSSSKGTFYGNYIRVEPNPYTTSDQSYGCQGGNGGIYKTTGNFVGTSSRYISSRVTYSRKFGSTLWKSSGGTADGQGGGGGGSYISSGGNGGTSSSVPGDGGLGSGGGGGSNADGKRNGGAGGKGFIYIYA